MGNTTDDLTDSKKELLIKTDKPDSVELRQSAKGEVFWTVKVYGNTNDEIIQKVKELRAGIEKELSR